MSLPRIEAIKIAESKNYWIYEVAKPYIAKLYVPKPALPVPPDQLAFEQVNPSTGHSV